MACMSARRRSGRVMSSDSACRKARPERIMPRRWRNCGPRGSRARYIRRKNARRVKRCKLWAAKRKTSPALPGNQVLQLRNVLEAIGNVVSDPPASLKLLKGTFQSLTGQALDISRWQDSLYERLSGNEVAYQIADALMRPRSMGDLVEDLAQRLGRPVPEEEGLICLALGAAAQR